MLFEQVTVVGVGLIGGSVGLAVRARKIAGRVVGVGRDPKTLARAAELGAVDAFSTELAAGVKAADLVVMCTPVDRIASGILDAASHVRPGTIFTDAGSTKQNIVEALAGKLPPNVWYIPAHPLAGAEKAGVEHARADLFQNRVTIITQNTPEVGSSVAPTFLSVRSTPTLSTASGSEPTSQHALSGRPLAALEPPIASTDRNVGATGEQTADARVEAFWRALGCRIVRMDTAEHDRVLACTSHLPHAVASGLAGVTPVNYLPLSAGGFRDTTRIAAGDPMLWAAIFQANREQVLSALRSFSDQMAEFQRLLEADDKAGLVKWLTEGKQVRDALGS
jgi:prephenate dehydrogenase